MDVSIIIPVGPGHEQIAPQAVQSVMLATEDSQGPFDTFHIIIGDDTKGDKGRSRTRNICVQGPVEEWMVIHSTGEDPHAAFESDWLFFLDADDLMVSSKVSKDAPFLSPFRAAQSEIEKEVDAVWGQIYEVDLKGNVTKRKQVGRMTTYSAYIKHPPYITCQMGHFVRRDAFMGFDEERDVCEDVDYYLRMWKDRECVKITEPLFLNRRGAHTWMTPRGQDDGRLTHTGRDWSREAERMLREARDAYESGTD